MASSKRPKKDAVIPRVASTADGQESQMVSLTMNLAREQLINGTASSQTIGHFLKLGSSREQLEQERMANEVALLEAKVEALQGAKRMEELLGDAIAAFGIYNGTAEEAEEEWYD